MTRPALNRREPSPHADALARRDQHTLVYQCADGWRSEARDPASTAPAWAAIVRCVAAAPSTRYVRVYNRAGRCTWDSRDGGTP